MFRAPVSKLATVGATLAALSAASALAAGPLHRFGLLETRPALLLLMASLAGAGLAIAFGALGIRATLGLDGRRGRMRAVLAIATGVAVLAVPAPHMMASWTAPPIHDITTDPDDPPAFEALAEAREAAPNAVEHPGEEVAERQRMAYPDVEPRLYDTGDIGRDAVWAAIRDEAREQGWSIEAGNPGEGVLEAEARTPWFGFVDDVVVRLRETDEGVRVDVRSASRVGESDLGANARRITGYLEGVDAALGIRAGAGDE